MALTRIKIIKPGSYTTFREPQLYNICFPNALEGITAQCKDKSGRWIEVSRGTTKKAEGSWDNCRTGGFSDSGRQLSALCHAPATSLTLPVFNRL